jgi:hypothetical protein
MNESIILVANGIYGLRVISFTSFQSPVVNSNDAPWIGAIFYIFVLYLFFFFECR